MSPLSVEFVGGPLDGRRETLPTPLDGPPPVLEFGYVPREVVGSELSDRVVDGLADYVGCYRWTEYDAAGAFDRYAWQAWRAAP